MKTTRTLILLSLLTIWSQAQQASIESKPIELRWMVKEIPAGDTLVLDNEWNMAVRLYGICTAPAEDKIGQQAIRRLKELTEDRMVVMELKKYEGNLLLVNARVGTEDLAIILLREGLAQTTQEATPEMQTMERQAQKDKQGAWSEGGIILRSKTMPVPATATMTKGNVPKSVSAYDYLSIGIIVAAAIILWKMRKVKPQKQAVDRETAMNEMKQGIRNSPIVQLIRQKIQERRRK